MKRAYLIFIVTMTFLVGNAQKEISNKVVFEPTVESLQQYECPEWFRDAKFGIWAHWTGYCASKGMGDWYARNMYIEGHPAYKHHLKEWGHPSEVGYKDVIDTWKAENFDPEALMKLYKDAGAKYFIALANHHDNFDLWDSKHQKWNSVNYGPQIDMVGKWREAALKEGLRWGVTSHLERTWSWFQTNKGADKKGPYKGVAYDGANPELEFIYLPPEPTGDQNQAQPKNATKWWRDHWFARSKDLIDNYKPDLFYVDGGVPFPGEDKGKTGLKLMAHLYNSNAGWHNGNNEAVMCLKNWLHVAPDGSWGHWWDGIGTQDCERTRLNKINPKSWQTDTSVSGWSWTPDSKYRSTKEVIHELVDIVSKNGNLLLNVPIRPDGTLDNKSQMFLKEMGEWMKANGDAIYATRPWMVAQEGPTHQSGHHHSPEFKSSDIRYTQSKDGETLFATALAFPENELTLQLTKVINVSDDAKVTMLANGKNIPFKIGKRKQLVFDMTGINPDNAGCSYAFSFSIEGMEIVSVDYEPMELIDLYLEAATNYEPLPGNFNSQYPYLSGVEPIYKICHNGVKRDINYREKGAIKIGGKTYEHGLMVCPSGELNCGIFIVKTEKLPKIKGFTAEIGIDDAVDKTGTSAFIIEAFVKGKWTQLYKSRVLNANDEAVSVDVKIPSRAKFIKFVTTDGGNGCSADHAVWADAKFY